MDPAVQITWIIVGGVVMIVVALAFLTDFWDNMFRRR